MKKVYIKLALVTVLLLTLIFALGICADAADETFSVCVHYNGEGDADGCKSLVLSYTDVDGTPKEQPVESGVTYQVSIYATNIRLNLTLHPGYDIKSASGAGGGMVYFTSDDLEYNFGSDPKNTEFTIETQHKTYTIKYILQTVVNGITVDADMSDRRKPETHTYKTTTVIDNPTLSGYVFQKWLVLPEKPGPDFDPTGYTSFLNPGKENFVQISDTYFPEGVDDEFYLYPVWEPIKYPLYCQNVVYYNGTILTERYFVGEFPAGVIITGKDVADYVSADQLLHIGYHFDEENGSKNRGTHTMKVDDGDRTAVGYVPVNTIYRYYAPYVYDLEYGCSVSGGTLTFPEGTVLPETHQFDANTAIPSPSLSGYHFAGWRAEVYDAAAGTWKKLALTKDEEGDVIVLSHLMAGREELHSDALEGKNTIRLIAEWTPVRVSVTYNGLSDVGATFPTVAPEEYVFNMSLPIPNPIRKGYTFLGWTVNSGAFVNQEIAAGDGVTELPAFSYIEPVSLSARWQANVYEVTLGGNGADEGWTDIKFYVAFDAVFSLPSDMYVAPQKTGNDFMGFYWINELGEEVMYTDADGNVLVPVWQIDRNTTLLAKWSPRPYDLSIMDETGALIPNAVVAVNGVPYLGGTLTIRYGTTVTVTVTAADGYKLVQWQGPNDAGLTAIDHTGSFEYTFSMVAKNFSLVGVTAPVISAPTFRVDYETETLKGDTGRVPDGSYVVICGDRKMEITVADGKFTITEDGTTRLADSIPIWDGAFGSEIKIVVRGDGSTTADSDPITLSPTARPEKPTTDDLDPTSPTDTSIIVQMKPPVDLSLYEFACIESDDVTKVTRWYRVGDPELLLPYEGAVMFENLKPGTPYYVFVRTRATATTPHGFVNTFKRETKSHDTLEAKKQELLDMMQDTDGDMVNILIQNAIDDLTELQHAGASSDFQSNLDAILSYVNAQIGFARSQDEAVASLRALRDSLLLSQTLKFDAEDAALIDSFLAVAVDAIQKSTTSEGVRAAYNLGESNIKGVSYTTVISGNVTLTSYAGIKQGLLLLHSRMTDISDLNTFFNKAVKSGAVDVNGEFLSREKAARNLRSMSLLAAYKLELNTGSSVYTAFDGRYEVRLLLEEDLSDKDGLQVAYYSQKDGKLILLETKRINNELVFYADSVENFLILGDPSINLTVPMITLGVILLFQWIAIAMLLVWRKKNTGTARLNSFALVPVLLTVRFTPANSFAWLLVLGALVILSQAFLIYLILTSNIRRKGASNSADPEPTAFAEDSDSTSAAMIFDDDEAEELLQESETSEEEEDLADLGDAGAYTYDTESTSYDDDDFAIRTEETTEFSLENEDGADDAGNGQEIYIDENSEDFYPIGEDAQETVSWTYEEEGVTDQPAVGESDVAYWRMDPQTGEVFEVPAEEASEEFAEDFGLADTKDETDGSAEDTAEEESDDVIYVEPDVIGEEAPAPEGYYTEDTDE